MTYEQEVTLSQEALKDLKWWINNITLSQGAPLKLKNPDIVMSTDASSHEGWGASLEGGDRLGDYGQRKRKKCTT